MKAWIAASLPIALVVLAGCLHAPPAAEPAGAADAIRGRVVDEHGAPLAGAWVGVTDDDVATKERRTVISDDHGAFSVGGLPAGHHFELRARIYGYADRRVRNLSAGRVVDVAFTDGDRLSPAETAAQDPSSYWLSLLHAPVETGSTNIHSSADWTTEVMYSCGHCHQVGTRALRQPRTRAQWDETFRLAPRMNQMVDRLGRERVLDLFTDWSDRIRRGELPATAPRRPAGDEAKFRLTEWEVGSPLGWYREIAAGYDWNPHVGAAAPRGASGRWVYTADVPWGNLIGVDVDTGEKREWPIPHGSLIWPYGSWQLWKAMNSAPITLQVDSSGRVVIVALVDDSDPPGTLVNGLAGLLGKYDFGALPDGRKWGGNHDIAVFDPRTESFDPIPTTCDNHALTIDKQGRYWLTREEDRVCVYDPATKTERSYPWPKDWGKGIVGANDVAPDGTLWFFFIPQDWVARFDPKDGSFKRWKPPEPGHLPRHVCVDSQGRPYFLLLSGQLARMDPKDESWKLWDVPDARQNGLVVNVGFSCAVDKTGDTGIQDAVFISGNYSDSIIRFDPQRESFTTFRMPESFYTKDLEIFDGALWAMQAENPEKYIEPDPDTGVAQPKLVRFDFLR